MTYRHDSIDVVLPAHNEGEAIDATLREFYDIVAVKGGQPLRFVVCEDGSTDNTVAVLKSVAETLPLKLISEPIRKGYSRAVIDGFRATESAWVCFIDSDGQCDPQDFDAFLKHRDGADLVMGWRNPRADHWIRKAMSGAFGVVYRLLFHVRQRDPSCPYLLIRQEALQKILRGRVGILKQGFWWEFLARALSNGLKVVEIPVRHRVRSAGVTQVYRPSKVPRIAYEHLLGLIKLRQELKQMAPKN